MAKRQVRGPATVLIAATDQKRLQHRRRPKMARRTPLSTRLAKREWAQMGALIMCSQAFALSTMVEHEEFAHVELSNR